jgi:hypothetical protein
MVRQLHRPIREQSRRNKGGQVHAATCMVNLGVESEVSDWAWQQRNRSGLMNSRNPVRTRSRGQMKAMILRFAFPMPATAHII